MPSVPAAAFNGLSHRVEARVGGLAVGAAGGERREAHRERE